MAQHDQVLADQAGAAFRADLNNALAAIFSNNSGATEPSVTTPYMWWVDATAGWLKQRNAADDAWINKMPLADAMSTVGSILYSAASAAAARTALAVLSSAENQTQAASRFTVGGTANALTGTLSPAIAAYAAGLRVTTTPGGANTITGPTLNLNGLGAKTIKKRDSAGTKVALAAGDYNASGPFDFEYDGTDFVLLNPSAWTVNARGADIASASTISLTTATGDIVDVTGTTAITAITLADGLVRQVRFTGALTLTNGASLVLPGGANIATAVGDVATFRGYAAGVVRCTGYSKANGKAVSSSAGIVLGTPVASTSGTSIDFTSIPNGTTRIVIHFDGVSVTGTSPLIVQIGDSGGVEATGYAAASNANASLAGYTAGFGLQHAGLAAGAFRGQCILALMDASANKWSSIHVGYRSSDNAVSQGSGIKSLSAALDRVRITTVGGTDTFDAGSINITYE